MTNDTDRVLFLMQPTAKTAFEALYPEEATRNQMVTDSLAVEGNATLAAAALLEMLCDSYRARAAQSPTSSATKVITVGPIKIEKFAADGKSDADLADIFCGRAKVLRRAQRRTGRISLATPLHVLRQGSEP